MGDGLSAVGFGLRRGRSFFRITAYTLILVFVFNTLPTFLPFPFGQNQALLNALQQLVERSTLPVVSLVFLYQGFVDGALPALWEYRLALAVRPLLGLVALGYLLIAISIVALSLQLQSDGIRQLESQRLDNLNLVIGYEKRLMAATDVSQLRAVLDEQPAFRPLMRDTTAALGTVDRPLVEQRQAAKTLMDRAEADLQYQFLRRRADLAGSLTNQGARLSLSSLSYTGFYLLISLLWPRSDPDLEERIRQARIVKADEDNAPGE